MKTSALTFLAGIAVGAAIFKVSSNAIEPEGIDEHSAQSTIQSSTRSQTGTPQGKGNGRASRQRNDQGQAIDPTSLLDRIQEFLNAGALEVSDLHIARLLADIGSLSATETLEMMRALEDLSEEEDDYDSLDIISQMVAVRLIELQGLQAVEAFENNQYPIFMERFGSDFVYSMLSFWTDQDPESAKDWVVSKINAGEDDNGTLSEQLLDFDVLETFFLHFENKRPGESMDLISSVTSEEIRNELVEYALTARIELGHKSGGVSGILDEGLSLIEPDAFDSLLQEAAQKDWQTTKQWVEQLDSADHKEQSILTVGQSLLFHSELGKRDAIAWLLNQDLSDKQSRIQRLKILSGHGGNGIGQFYGFPPSLSHTEFINPVDRVVIPGIPPSPIQPPSGTNGTPGPSSIDWILNNPNRTSTGQDSAIMANQLHQQLDHEFDGVFNELIETEIRELDLQYDPPELPNQMKEEE